MTSELTAYNALLLKRTLSDNDVSDEVVSSVFDAIEDSGVTYNIEKDTLSNIFDEHDIGYLTDLAFQELEKDGPALPYGSIACP